MENHEESKEGAPAGCKRWRSPLAKIRVAAAVWSEVVVHVRAEWASSALSLFALLVNGKNSMNSVQDSRSPSVFPLMSVT